MSAPEHLEISGDLAVFRPAGQMSFDRAVQMVTSAIAFAREKRIGKLLVVTSDLTGFEPPSILTRFLFVKEWARAAGGAVCVAIVARPEMIDRKKFGVTVATNRGLISDVFVSEAEEEAMAWLQSVR